MQLDDATQLTGDDLTRKQLKQRALNRFQTGERSPVYQTPKELKAMDMLNLKRNFLLATDKALQSERARNFQIELTTPTQEAQW